MKKIYLGLLLFFTSFQLFSQTSFEVGVIRGSSSDKTSITKMEFDEYDYHVIFGKFYDSVKVEPFTQSTALYGGLSNVHNAFFSVYDSDGFLYFAHKLGNSTDSVSINAATFDFSGNLYIGGSFIGTVDFADNAGSPFYLTSTGTGSNAFLAKFDFSGNFLNAIVLESNGTYASVNSISSNGPGDLVVVGSFDGSIDVDGSASNVDYTATSIDGFICTYYNDLTYQSSTVLDGPGNQIPKNVITNWADIHIGGVFENQIDFDLSGTTNIAFSNGAKDVFMIYMDNIYSTLEYISFGGPGIDKLKDLLYRPSQGYYALVDFEQTVNFDPNFGTTNLTSNGQSDVAIVRYFNNFQLGYVKQFGNANNDIGYRISHNQSGGGRQNRGGGPPPSYPEDDFIFTMGFSGTVDINPEPAESANITSSNTSMNSAIINIDSSGNYLFHGVIQASSIVGFKSTGMNGNTIRMAGNFSGNNVDLLPYSASSSFTHTGPNSGFYVHYDRCQMTASAPRIVEPYACGTCEAKLTVDNIFGGVAPYYFNWNNGDNYSYDQLAVGMCPDNNSYYNMVIEDFYGCIHSDTLWVRGYDTLPNLDMILNVTNTSCGNNFGSATATPLNNIGSVSYLWSNGSVLPSADSLLAGNYFVQLIDDSLFCYYEKNFFVENSDGPVITLNSAIDPACGNTDNGSIDVTVTGGATPYTFLWSNGATTEDLTLVGGGTYTLTVTDATGCENSLCLSLYQPDGIVTYLTNTYTSSCNFNDGMLTVESYGGFTPYTYQWDANAGSSTNDTVYSLYAGIYTGTVTDSMGCTENFKFAVSDYGWWTPYVSYNYITNPNCLGTNGYIDAYTAAYAGTGTMTYLWDSGETTEDIAVGSGVHLLQVTDEDGCKTIGYFDVYQELPNAPTVCMVTVDSTATQNVVVWDKSTTQEADYYNIYREGFCNQNDFGIVGVVDFDALSVFYDTVVNSDTRTWRYYVTAVDTCGFESNQSEIHRTIHLTANVDSDTNVVLDWSDYVGMQILGYKVYRKQPVGTLFDYVDSVGAFTTNYLDTIDFTGYGEVVYFVDAIPASVCNATRAYNQNEARSNHSRVSVPEDTSTISVNELTEESSISLYPNPTNDMVNLKVNSKNKNWTLQMMDQTGRIILSGKVQDKAAAFSTKEIAAGVYFIRMTSDTNEIHTMKLMIVH